MFVAKSPLNGHVVAVIVATSRIAVTGICDQSRVFAFCSGSTPCCVPVRAVFRKRKADDEVALAVHVNNGRL